MRQIHFLHIIVEKWKNGDAHGFSDMQHRDNWGRVQIFRGRARGPAERSRPFPTTTAAQQYWILPDEV